MSMRNGSAPGKRAPLVVGLLAGAAVVVVLGLLVREFGPGNMGNGVLAGGSIALLGIGAAAWRAWHRPDDAGPLERHFAGSADERDAVVLTRALAVAGVTALPLTGLATVAIAVGLRWDIALAVLLFAQLAILVVAYRREVVRG